MATNRDVAAARHTPGPWTVESAGFGQWGIRGAGPDYKSDIATVNIGTDPARDHADVLLIAAAPDLLAALLRLVKASLLELNKQRRNGVVSIELTDATLSADEVIYKARGAS